MNHPLILLNWLKAGFGLHTSARVVLAGLLMLGGQLVLPAGYMPAAYGQEASAIGLTSYPDGKPVQLGQLKGKLVVANFWAPWCVPCRREFPEFQKLSDKYGAKGLAVVAITAEENPKKIAKFIEATGAKLTVWQDVTSTLHEKMKVSVMPTTLLLDRQGNLIGTYQGFDAGAGLAALEQDIVKHL
ncbi:MAG: TlpA family protein disulfide reductase [Deltaproteobacteria bacterium]|nr:TlpA family protein disulfide reductase [Deltaproteobacteria bacterium]